MFENALKKELTVHCVALTSSGTWFCLTSGGWWTSDVNHPASKMIADLDRKGHKLHGIAVAPEFGPHDFQKFDEIVQQNYDEKRPGGYAYAVMHKGKVVASRAHGWARAPWEKHNPSVKWTLDKPMGVASVSKAITAVSLLKLWEEKGQKFSLDDPFWPHIKAICPQASAGAKTVTIRQLLQHKSGFKKGLGDLETPAALEKLLTLPLAHMAGTHYDYDNNNFYIARLVLEQIGHVQYTPYIKERVLAPMGITHMETHYQAHAPTCGYGKLGSTRPGFPFDWDMTAKAGGAGWYASINDMCRFLRGLRDHTVLTPATTDMMYKDMLGWDISKPGWEKNGGWSWDEGDKAGSRAGAFLTSLYHFPDDVDAIMFINSDCEPGPENNPPAGLARQYVRIDLAELTLADHSRMLLPIIFCNLVQHSDCRHRRLLDDSGNSHGGELAKQAMLEDRLGHLNEVIWRGPRRKNNPGPNASRIQAWGINTPECFATSSASGGLLIAVEGINILRPGGIRHVGPVTLVEPRGFFEPLFGYVEDQELFLVVRLATERAPGDREQLVADSQESPEVECGINHGALRHVNHKITHLPNIFALGISDFHAVNRTGTKMMVRRSRGVLLRRRFVRGISASSRDSDCQARQCE